MIPSDDVLTGLPAPLDDEPPSVRQDIADELADHLACAYRRELFKTADEPTAQQRVLDRFGNPQRIAYQLWFQALWGRIMLNRFAKVVQGLKIVGGLVALFLIVRMAEQQSALHNQIVFMTSNYNSMQSQAMGTRNLLEQVLQRLPQPPQQSGYEGGMGAAGGMMSADGAMMGMGSAAMAPGMMGGSMSGAPMEMGGFAEDPNTVHPGLTVRLTMQGTKGEPASGCVVAVVSEQGQPLQMLRPASESAGESMGMGGRPGAAPSSFGWNGPSMRQTSASGDVLTPEMRGTSRFIQRLLPGQGITPIEPGRYTVFVEFHDGRQAQRLIVIPPSTKAAHHTEEIVCPAPSQNAYVVIHTPILPQDLTDAGLSVVASVKRKPITIEGTEWLTGNSADDLFLDFDPKTGAPTRYDRNSGNYTSFFTYFAHGDDRGRHTGTKFGNLATADRFLKLPSGSYEVMLGWWDNRTERLIHRTQMSDDSDATPGIPFGYLAAGAAEMGVLTIHADTRDVLLDFPEGMLDVAKKILAERSLTTQTTPTPTSTTPESETAKP